MKKTGLALPTLPRVRTNGMFCNCNVIVGILLV